MGSEGVAAPAIAPLEAAQRARALTWSSRAIGMAAPLTVVSAVAGGVLLGGLASPTLAGRLGLGLPALVMLLLAARLGGFVVAVLRFRGALPDALTVHLADATWLRGELSRALQPHTGPGRGPLSIWLQVDGGPVAIPRGLAAELVVDRPDLEGPLALLSVRRPHLRFLGQPAALVLALRPATLGGGAPSHQGHLRPSLGRSA